ncbi:hypothetical protein MHU86_23848 [Fragilaria crotonensis]|nr:hypothetical protein MHU86_23848 [Fragilaria crotonensis]
MLNATALTVNPPNALAYVLAIPWLLVPFVLFIVVVMAGRSRANAKILPRIARYTMPLLCLLTMASTALAIIMLAYATANADFCSGGQSNTPDETILEMVLARGFEADSLVFLATEYYVSQCDAEYPYDFVDTFMKELETASLAISAVESAIATKLWNL